MNRLFYLFLFIIFGSIQAQSQTFTIVSPAGLTPPYEVAPGTEVTFKWDYFFEYPTSIFTYTEAPVFPGFGTDPNWTDIIGSSTVVDNGDGTYNVTTTINEKVWIWGGFFSPFISQWNYSDPLEINVASDVVISGDDLLLCDDGADTETLSVVDTFSNYQWYMNGIAITGATTASYDVAQPGSYYVAATYNSEVVNSNTLNLSYISISFSGALGLGGSDLDLTTTSGMDTYQWLSGPDENNLSPIAGANAETYTATISANLTYYAVEATLGGCTVQTNARPVVESFFTPPIIMTAADTNSFNVICEGTPVTFSVDDNYDSYKWLRDGFDAFNSSNSITVNQSWQEGNYSVEVSNAEWAEITLTSATVNLNYQDVISPQLIGVNNFQQYCPGENIDVVLNDEGYTYTWYLHSSSNNYTNDDIINVAGNTYSFTFDTAIYITVVGEFQGCTAIKSVFLNSYANSNIFLNTADFNQDYLCTDSMNTIFIPSWAAGDYQDFQWYQEVNGIFEPIAGADTTLLEIDMPGVYQLQASVVACPSVTVTSSDKIIFDYTERELLIWSTDATLCVGDTATLNISGGFNWENIQWFEEDIVIGSNGYEKEYVPIIGAGSDASQTVAEFQTYQAKARHFSCPNGLKITSNIIGLRPTVNPTITPDPNYGINSWHTSPYDSIPNYVFCAGEPVLLSLSGQYDSYAWYSLLYAGDDDYALGDVIAGAISDTITVNANVDWFTAVVDSAGCVGYSDPVIIDTWAFSPPAIASYNNAELCMEGDSTLLHLGFPGDWGAFEWYLDGTLIPDSNNDSIYAKEPGMYTITAYPTLCPEFGYSSGIGPTVSYLEADILENDTLIFAFPQFGLYTYQWYFNGNPIPFGPEPSALYKDSLMNGIYTVEVSNENCTVLSDQFTWDQVSIGNININDINVYPNPTRDFVVIEGLEASLVDKINVFNLVGMRIKEFNPMDEQIEINLSDEKQGIYILEVKMKSGESLSWKINRI